MFVDLQFCTGFYTLSAMKPVESLHNLDYFTVQHHMVDWLRGSKSRVEKAVHGDCRIMVGIKISGFSHTYDCQDMKAVSDT